MASTPPRPIPRAESPIGGGLYSTSWPEESAPSEFSSELAGIYRSRSDSDPFIARALKVHILVVEDSAFFQKFVPGMLRKLGFTVTLAETGEKAIKVATQEGASFHVILMDIQLGKGIDGFQATAQIRKTRPNLPIISFSSDETNTLIDRGKVVQMTGHIRKTINDKEFRNAFAPFFSGLKI